MRSPSLVLLLAAALVVQWIAISAMTLDTVSSWKHTEAYVASLLSRLLVHQVTLAVQRVY
uniref:Uncharacterized protein n=1 Tax=Arundo donax TaxID=35708 RepID=A0A0A9F173_ARUDO